MGRVVVEVAAYDRTPEPLRTAARALSRASFLVPDETAEQLAERRDRFSGQGDAIRHIIATQADAVVGFAIAYRRAVAYKGRSLVLGGIGDVCVRPESRRQGIATRVTQAALRELELAGCDVAYLCALLEEAGLTALYERVGFKRVAQGHTYLGASGTRYVDHDGMIAPVRSRALFEAILGQPEPFDIGHGNW